jgi:Galactose oxidase, central domain
MKKKSTLRSACFNPRALMSLFLCCAGVIIAFFPVGASKEPFERPNKAQPGALKTTRAISHELDPMTIASFNPAGGTWTVTGSLNTPRAGHTATLLANGMVLAAGGGASLARTELYDPASGSWAATGSLNTPRSDHTATLLPNDKVLVTGGFSIFIETATAELYDPASGTWTATGNLNTARRFHTATLLSNGMVLVAGGQSDNPVTASAELFDAASGSWTATGNLNTERTQHTATLLLNGMVLVAGGLIATPLLSRAQNCTIQPLEAGLPPVSSTTNAGRTRQRCCPTALCLSQGDVTATAVLALSQLRNYTIRQAELGLPSAISVPHGIFTPQRCCPTAWCWRQGELIAFLLLPPTRSCSIRRAGAGLPPAISTRHARVTPARCCPTAWC